MQISPQHEALRCLLVVALLTGATSTVTAQSTSNSSTMLGSTARQMLSGQAVSQPDFVLRAPYVGFGVGASSLEPDTSQVPGLTLTDGEQVGFQLTVGMDFSEWFSGEFHVAELGEAELSDNSSLGYREFGLSALVYLGPNRDRFNRRGWSAFGRAGLGYLENGVSEGLEYRQEEAGQWILGAGAEYSTMSGFGVRAEGMVYDSDVSYLQIGLLYRFAKLPGGLSGIADLGVSSVAQAEVAKPDVADAESAAAAEDAKAEAEAEAAKATIAEAERAELALAEAERAQLARAEAERAELARTEAERAELARAEAELAELARAEADRAELARAEAERAELARAEAELAELARAEADRAELASAEAERAKQAARAQVARAELNGVIDGLKFAPGSADLSGAASRVLDSVVAALQDAPQKRARVNTHTDNVGGAEANLRLSQQRALAIARYLVQQGISKSRLEARAFGQRRPIASNDSAAGRDKNGRVEIFLIE